MKTLVCISGLFFSLTFNVLSQEPTWNQTAEYIKTISELYGQGNPSKPYTIKIDNYGNISEKFTAWGSESEIIQVNFNIQNILYDSIQLNDYVGVDGIRYYKIRLKCKTNCNCVIFDNHKLSERNFLLPENKIDAEKLYKAYKHLKKLSKNIKELF